MDDARYTDPATGLPIPPANAAKVLSDPHKKLWVEAMRIEEETLDKFSAGIGVLVLFQSTCLIIQIVVCVSS